MSVLACDRNGCENIMCDYYSSTHGYLCHECRKELKTKPFIDISEFMESPKSTKIDPTGYWENFVNETFISR